MQEAAIDIAGLNFGRPVGKGLSCEPPTSKKQFTDWLAGH